MERCTKLQRLELQGNRVVDVKSFPQNLDSLQILYLQEFDMTGQNMICQMPGYEAKVFKIFPKLRALDGNRKNVPMNYNMREAVPEEEDTDVQYNADQVEWFDQAAFEEVHPEKNRFEDSTVLKREEAQFKGMMKDIRELLDKKTNILTY